MKIENQKLNVVEAFKNFYYVVPNYQREYVWEESNVEQLLLDIYDEYQNDKTSEYFIGSIVVNKEEDGNYAVIDGQQRLTTLFVSMCAFKKNFENNESYINLISQFLSSSNVNPSGEIINTPHMVLQYDNTSELLQNLLNGVIENQVPSESGDKIIGTYKYVLDFLKTNFRTKEELISFFGYFSSKVSFIQIETPSISDALKIFETVNDRGVGLDSMDLLKNLIFRNLDKVKFTEMKNKWKEIVERLEKNRIKKLRFLRYFIMANYEIDDQKDKGIVREDQIYNWISKNTEQTQYNSDPFGFVRKIGEDAKFYVEFNKGKNQDGEINIHLYNIIKLSGGFSQHIVMLLAAQNLSKEVFVTANFAMFFTSRF